MTTTAPHLSVSSTRLGQLLQPWPAQGTTGPGTGPAYRALADRVRGLILDGRLPLTARIPAERQLADRLGVSRTTIAAAYDLLRSDGYLHSRRGSGSWTTLPGTTTEIPTRSLAPTSTSGLIDLGPAALPGPGRPLHRALADATDSLPAYTTGHGYYPLGIPLLRETLADRYTRRGLPTSPDQIIVTTGALTAFTLVMRTLLRTGDRVAVESPTYANGLEAITQTGARPLPVPMTHTGWDTDAWRDTLRTAAPRLAFVIPDFHNPTGHLADTETRRTLTTLARATGTTLVVDETCADLDLDGNHPTSLATWDQDGSVITLGSTSKTFWGGLRIGWIRTTPGLARRIAATRGALDGGAPVLEQLLTHHLITDHETTIMETRLPALRTARDHLASQLRTHLPDWTFTTPPGGLSLWAHLGTLSASDLSQAATRHGVRIAPGTHFGSHGTFEHHLRIPYTLDTPTLTEAVRRLARAAAETHHTPGTTHTPTDTTCLA